MTDTADNRSSAELISFPGRFRPPVDGAERLDRAVCALEQANRELREAVAAWREVIDQLSVSVGGIAAGLQALDAEWTAIASRQPTNGDDEVEHAPMVHR